MKVAIWQCYGGFSLSAAAYEFLIKEKHWSVTTTVPVSLELGGKKYDNLVEYVPLNNYADIICSDSYGNPRYPRGGYSFNLVKWDTHDVEFRTHSDVIEMLETLGPRACRCETIAYKGEPCIKIIDIPDGIDFYIEEYEGGSESIHEHHRIWS